VCRQDNHSLPHAPDAEDLADARRLKFSIARPSQAGQIDLPKHQKGYAIEIGLSARHLRPALRRSVIGELTLIKRIQHDGMKRRGSGWGCRGI
jgi:hypothetical protein